MHFLCEMYDQQGAVPHFRARFETGISRSCTTFDAIRNMKGDLAGNLCTFFDIAPKDKKHYYIRDLCRSQPGLIQRKFVYTPMDQPGDGKWLVHPLKKAFSLGGIDFVLSYVKLRLTTTPPPSMATASEQKFNMEVTFVSREDCDTMGKHYAKCWRRGIKYDDHGEAKFATRTIEINIHAGPSDFVEVERTGAKTLRKWLPLTWACLDASSPASWDGTIVQQRRPATCREFLEAMLGEKDQEADLRSRFFDAQVWNRAGFVLVGTTQLFDDNGMKQLFGEQHGVRRVRHVPCSKLWQEGPLHPPEHRFGLAVLASLSLFVSTKKLKQLHDAAVSGKRHTVTWSDICKQVDQDNAAAADGTDVNIEVAELAALCKWPSVQSFVRLADIWERSTWSAGTHPLKNVVTNIIWPVAQFLDGGRVCRAGYDYETIKADATSRRNAYVYLGYEGYSAPLAVDMPSELIRTKNPASPARLYYPPPEPEVYDKPDTRVYFLGSFGQDASNTTDAAYELVQGKTGKPAFVHIDGRLVRRLRVPARHAGTARLSVELKDLRLPTHSETLTTQEWLNEARVAEREKFSRSEHGKKTARELSTPAQDLWVPMPSRDDSDFFSSSGKKTGRNTRR